MIYWFCPECGDYEMSPRGAEMQDLIRAHELGHDQFEQPLHSTGGA